MHYLHKMQGACADADQVLACIQIVLELASMVMPHADMLLQIEGHNADCMHEVCLRLLCSFCRTL